MAYDRFDTRDEPRGSRSRDERDLHRGRDRSREDRGFFERAGDEIASWFGDDDRGRRDERPRFTGSDRDEDRGRFWRERSWDRGDFERDRDFERERGRGYRPVTGDYARSEGFFAAGGAAPGDSGRGWREREPTGRDDHRRTEFAGSSERSRELDPHYHSWRSRQIDDLDRDYEEYRRENQSRFEDDFSNWRQRRQQKRAMLGQIREQMEVIGNDDKHVGTIDHVAGDRIILAKSDPDSGGVHRSLSCADVDRVEGDRVILDCSSTEAHVRWRDESRSRALFEREDQGEMGPRVLDRSFEGTYRDKR